ncbi:MAG: DUF4214 domain-containing protein [Actinomycetota bacterium]
MSVLVRSGRSVFAAALVLAVVAAALIDARPSDAASGGPVDICRPHASNPGSIDGILVPAALPAADAAIVVGDPDAEDFPMAPARYPDEMGLWASTGTNGAALTATAARTSIPVPTSAVLNLDRSDKAVSDAIVRIHCGLLERKIEPHELEYWARRYWNGLPLSSIAAAFTTSTEFIERHGNPSDEALVAMLYRTVLGREPAAGGVKPFLEMLHSGEMTRGSLVVAFTDSPEYVAITGTATPEKPPLPYPAVGSGRRVIYANREARVWFVEATGELAKTHQVSGRRGVPSPGRYRVYSKSRYAWAPSDGITMEYMVRFARQEWPYGFHSIPIWPDKKPLQTKEQLGSLRSGGCVRQDFDDAAFTFDWTDVGTRVVMIP